MTFTVAFSVFFPFPQMEPKGIIYLEEHFSFIFRIRGEKKKEGNFKIPIYLLTPNRVNVLILIVKSGCANESLPAC